MRLCKLIKNDGDVFVLKRWLDKACQLFIYYLFIYIVNEIKTVDIDISESTAELHELTQGHCGGESIHNE